MARVAEVSCSFCGKGHKQVRKLIAGPHGVYICDECVGLCTELVVEEEGSTPAVRAPRPKEIHAFLDEYVIGQERAKTTLAVAVYNHYKRVNAAAGELGKSNILLIGPTGSGKTHLVQTLARMLDVPFAIADATALTEAGYVGEDVDHLLHKLLLAADHDVRRAEKGIVYLDEIDKIARRSDGPSITRDVSGEGVQQALLKILEGTVAGVAPQGGRKHPHQESVQIDTTDILFIAGGAFAGLEEIIERRTRTRTIGYGAAASKAPADAFAQVMPQDLLAFGLIPELVGRLPILSTFEPLDRTALRRILTEPRNALTRQYQRLLEMDGVELVFTDAAIEAIAGRALGRGTGARAVRSIMEEVLAEVMFDVPGRGDIARVVVTEDDVLLIPHAEDLAS